MKKILIIIFIVIIIVAFINNKRIWDALGEKFGAPRPAAVKGE